MAVIWKEGFLMFPSLSLHTICLQALVVGLCLCWSHSAAVWVIHSANVSQKEGSNPLPCIETWRRPRDWSREMKRSVGEAWRIPRNDAPAYPRSPDSWLRNQEFSWKLQRVVYNGRFRVRRLHCMNSPESGIVFESSLGNLLKSEDSFDIRSSCEYSEEDLRSNVFCSSLELLILTHSENILLPLSILRECHSRRCLLQLGVNGKLLFYQMILSVKRISSCCVF